MAYTQGLRTWRRTGADTTLPLDARIVETTNADSIDAALRSADFVTIPRAAAHGPSSSESGPRSLGGYDDDYAEALAAALERRYGYEGGVRTSKSGRSYVIERARLVVGASVDLGLPAFDPQRLVDQPPPVDLQPIVDRESRPAAAVARMGLPPVLHTNGAV